MGETSRADKVYTNPFDILADIPKDDVSINFNTTKTDKEWHDDILFKMKFPSITVHDNVDDGDLKTAIKLFYRTAGDRELANESIKILCAIAVNELRDPIDPNLRIFKDPQYYGLDSNNSPVKIMEEGLDFNLTGLHQSTDAQGKILPNQQTTMSVPMSQIYKEVVDGKLAGSVEETQKYPNFTDQPLTLQEKIYIGAWAYYHLRAYVKQAPSMIGYQTVAESDGTVNNRMQKLINRLYDLTVPHDYLPPLTSSAYERLNKNMSRGELNSLGVIVRSACLDKYYDTRADPTAKRRQEVLKGLLLMVVSKHSLTAYVWAETASRLAGRTITLFLNQIAKDGITTEAGYRVYSFVFKYMVSKDDYGKLPPGKRNAIGKYIGGYYYPIARLINSDFLSSVGRVNNESFIYFCKELVIKLTRRESLSRFVIEVDSATKSVCDGLASRYYALIIKEKEGSKESEFLKNAPKDTHVTVPLTEPSDREDGDLS